MQKTMSMVTRFLLNNLSREDIFFLDLDEDLDLDLDLNLGQWLSRQVCCKFQYGEDEFLVLKLGDAF